MNDTKEITLPISGKKVVIRNYTTVADDSNAEAILFKGVSAEESLLNGQTIKFPMSNIMDSETSYVYRLVKSIDGNSDSIDDQLNELRSKDFAKIKECVDKIVAENSPKVEEARKTSTNNSKTK